MNQIKKKTAVWLAATALLATLLSGCGDGKTDTSNAVPDGAAVFAVEDYGAKGDGETDDGPAIGDAVKAAIKADGPAVVQFKKDAVYRILTCKLNSEGLSSAFIINKAEDLTLLGDNTTISIKTPMKFLHVTNSKNVTVSGLNFDYFVKPYTVSKIESASVAEKTAVIKAEQSLGIEGTWTAPPGDFFGLPMVTGRHHMFISRIDKLDGENRYTLHFKDEASLVTRLYMIAAEKPDFLTPIPDVAHTIGEAFTINENENVTMKNCEVWSAPQFVFNIRGNGGILSFDNVNIRPQPGTDEKMVAWRDGYHCKDNRAQILWNNCITQGVHDDTYNISSTLLTVTKVTSETEFQMTCTEYNGSYFELKPGDELTAYNVETGEFVGRTTITEVVRQSGSFNVVKVADPMPKLEITNVKVAVDSLCAPDSRLTNCKIDGSVRFRGKMAVENTAFKLLYMWIQNETIYEGPVPKDMLFKNCTFDGYGSGGFMSITTVYNGIGLPEYKCKNIRFEGCTIDRKRVLIGDGNEVIFS